MPTYPEDMHLRHWILDPVGHRREWLKVALENQDRAEFLGERATVVIAPPPPDGVWLCDWCNDPIPLTWPDGSPRMVPMLGSSALCPDCVSNQLTPEEMDFRDRAMDSPLWWSPQVCGCPADAKAAIEMTGQDERVD